MRRILISGAAGFIASHLVNALIQAGDFVVGVDDLSGGSADNLPTGTAAVNNFKFYQVDIANYLHMEEIMRSHRPQVVYHLASCAREGASELQPYKITKTNILISSIVLELGIKYKMEKFILFSSMSVYGKGKPPFDEKHPARPVDPYGVSKHATEQILWQLADTYKFDGIVLRPHNVIGPHQAHYDRYRNVVGIFINSILRGEPLYLFGENHHRAFSNIEDSLPCFIRAGEDKRVAGETINVGGKEFVTVMELAEEVIENMPEFPRPEIIQLPPRPHEVTDAYCTTTKSEEMLGYKESHGWREGVRRQVEWTKAKGKAEWRYDDLPLKPETMPTPWIKG